MSQTSQELSTGLRSDLIRVVYSDVGPLTSSTIKQRLDDLRELARFAFALEAIPATGITEWPVTPLEGLPPFVESPPLPWNRAVQQKGNGPADRILGAMSDLDPLIVRMSLRSPLDLVLAVSVSLVGIATNAHLIGHRMLELWERYHDARLNVARSVTQQQVEDALQRVLENAAPNEMTVNELLLMRRALAIDLSGVSRSIADVQVLEIVDEERAGLPDAGVDQPSGTPGTDVTQN